MSYPINFDVEGKTCIVIGGGHVAYRKVIGLLNANANVILIAPDICDELNSLVKVGQIEWKRQNYLYGCLPSGLILIAATDNEEVNSLAAEEAKSKHMLVNVVNKTECNDFNVPSVIRRGKLMITISTDGISPALSKMIRIHLEKQINENFVQWLERLADIRDEVKHIIKDVNKRELFWRNVMSSENFYLIQNGELDKAEVNIRNALDSYRHKSQNSTY